MVEEHDASEEALGGKIGELRAEVDGLGELVEGMGETPNVGMGRIGAAVYVAVRLAPRRA